MLKNKDGSYNKFPLLIIGLIALISLFIIGMLIIENINFPEFAASQTPATTLVETYSQENISSHLILYNATLGKIPNTTYANYTHVTYGTPENWTWINTNATYADVVSGIEYTNLSPNMSGPSPKIILTPLSQNISSIITYLNPFGSNILILLLVFPVVLILFNSHQSLIGIIMLLLFASFFNFISISNLILSVPLIIGMYILMTRLFDR